jgi:Ca-activated chloride channel family protein
VKPRWIDPHIRTSIALAVLILSVTGLVLADRTGGPSIWPSSVNTIATAPTQHAEPPTATSMQFRGDGAHGRFALSHSKLLASGRRSMFAEVQIFADEGRAVPVRIPITFVLVVDNSGSMAGQKIVDAKRSAITMIDQLHPDDQVAVVRFSTEASVVVPLMPASSARSMAIQEINRMSAMGNTDIANAVRTADRLVASVGTNRARRIVVVTDGRDTSGAPRGTAAEVARGAAARGITLSALGIGEDYDDAYLANLADSGRGNYEFLASTTSLDRFLQRELHETKQTTLQNLSATLELPSFVRVAEVWGATWDRSSHGVRLTFGSMHVGDERRAIVHLMVDAGPPGSWFTVGGQMGWNPVGGSPVRLGLSALRVEVVENPAEVDRFMDHSVLASSVSVRASERELEAARAFEKGDRGRALQLNAQNRADLDEAAGRATGESADRLRSQGRAYDENRSVYTTKPPSAAPARSIGARENKNMADAYAY